MRLFGILVIGLGGTAILLALGIWQVQRLSWKEDVLAQIEAKIAGPLQPLPLSANPETQTYMPISVQGNYVGPTLRVLVSQRMFGAGYRLISGFETSDGRRIMVDRGFVSVNDSLPELPKGDGEIRGNLHWPDEVDSFTPDNDLEENIWFARSVGQMAPALSAEPLLVILRSQDITDAGVTPLPVSTEAIPNNHLEYAVTWFGLAVIWLGMTGGFLYRMNRQHTNGQAR